MCTCTHTRLEGERRQVISGCQLPDVFQAESHSRSEALCRGTEGTKCAVEDSHWTIIYLKTSDRKRPDKNRANYTKSLYFTKPILLILISLYFFSHILVSW